MKPNQLIIFALFLTSLFMVSCSNQDDADTEIITETPLIQLQFTTPPIDTGTIELQFAEDIAYDSYNNTTFDIFLPTSPTPTGLVIFIHGGGFTGGGKGFIYNENYNQEVLELLQNNIAVATINYRLIQPGDTEGVLKSLNDSRRALQYIRYIHKELNIDKNNIVLFGSSAGAATSLWLATNDDFKDSNSPDPVLQESTRVKGIALRGTQSSLDIETRWLNDVFGEFETDFDALLSEFGEDRFLEFYGIASMEEYNTPEIEAYRQQIDMLGLITPDDPEIWVSNTGGHNNEPLTTSSFNHHPFHAREIKEFADAANVPNVTTYGNPILYSDNIDEDFVAFLMRKIAE